MNKRDPGCCTILLQGMQIDSEFTILYFLAKSAFFVRPVVFTFGQTHLLHSWGIINLLNMNYFLY